MKQFAQWFAFFVLALLARLPAIAQSDSLYDQLLHADSLLFEEGFNRCNFAVLEQLIHPDLVFLHDQGGQQDRAAFFQAIRENICAHPDSKPIRKLEPGSLSVYPMYERGVLYAAIQMGRHNFYIAEPGQPLRMTARAQFVHTWFWTDGKWQLKHVLSFDHH